MSRLFGHGDLRLYLLQLLSGEPRHGYELIVELETRFMGLYSPSPGTIYPRLAALEEEGLVASEEIDGRKVYRLTDAGRTELDERAEELKEISKRVTESARGLSREIRDEVKGSVRGLRDEMRQAARDLRAEDRRSGREQRESDKSCAKSPGWEKAWESAWENWRQAWQEAIGQADVGRIAADAVRESLEGVRQSLDIRINTQSRSRPTRERLRNDFRLLQQDLQAFVRDVAGAARRHGLDSNRMAGLRDLLSEARIEVIDLLERGVSRSTDE